MNPRATFVSISFCNMFDFINDRANYLTKDSWMIKDHQVRQVRQVLLSLH